MAGPFERYPPVARFNPLFGQGEFRATIPSASERVASSFYPDTREGAVYANRLAGALDWVPPFAGYNTGQAGAEAFQASDPQGIAVELATAATPPALKKGLRSARAMERKLRRSKRRMEKYASILDETVREGGSSTHLPTGGKPQSGYMVGIYKNTDPRNMSFGATGRPATPEDVHRFVATNQDELARDKYMGTWIDKETGETFFDVAKNIPSERSAAKFGELKEQRALYDLNRFNPETGKMGVSRNITPWKEYIQSPDYRERLRDLNAEGQEYMKQFLGQNWWAIPDFERVYGKDNVNQVIGFLAATSSNNAPPPNVQQMSEYMRRHIRGEPIIQPGYRIPKTAMGGPAGHPGSRMGMEGVPGDPNYSGRIHNLEAAARGDLEALRGPVVREKAAVLDAPSRPGNKNEAVMDRLQAYGAEDPEKLSFVMSEKGATPDDQQLRELWKQQQREEADKLGIDLATYSANVWAGIRERIKRTGELFGVDFRQTQKQTRNQPSHGYNDLFLEFIGKKAKHLGITVKEMEKRLASGDAELLAYIMAPFAGAVAFGTASGGVSPGTQPSPGPNDL